MSRYFVFLLLAASMMYSQAKPASKPVPQGTKSQATRSQVPATEKKAAPAAPAEKPAAPAKSAELPPDAPVITLNGFCPKATAGTDPGSPTCKTVVTKAEFEKLLHTLAPNAPPNAKQQLAGEYVRSLVLSAQADKMGLDETEHFKDVMNFMRMRALAQEFMTKVQEESKPTPADVQKYYQDNQSKYEEISLKRVFVPRNRPAPADTKASTPKEPTDAELKTEGEKVLTKLKGGESFDQAQKEAYEAAGFKTPPPPTAIPNWRFDAVPPAQQALFSLKKGEFSEVMIEAAGAYIYQVEDHKSIPLTQVSAEIENRLGNEKLQKTLERLVGSIKPDINQAYLQSGQPTDREVHALTPLAGDQAPPKSSTPPTPKK